jgi:hypothetical protein
MKTLDQNTSVPKSHRGLSRLQQSISFIAYIALGLGNDGAFWNTCLVTRVFLATP